MYQYHWYFWKKTGAVGVPKIVHDFMNKSIMWTARHINFDISELKVVKFIL